MTKAQSAQRLGGKARERVLGNQGIRRGPSTLGNLESHMHAQGRIHA